MHRVDRGTEPSGLSLIQQNHTLEWVNYFEQRIGNPPHRWNRFHADLCKAFKGLCAYCEEIDKGEVDHFRPKSRYPRMVYSWSNWVFACHNCNQKKREQWPPYGFVDPCARSVAASPESYFTFDLLSSELLPKEGLSTIRRKKALNTIYCLGLNDWFHLRDRFLWIRVLSRASVKDLRYFATRSIPLSSITRVFLDQMGISYRS